MQVNKRSRAELKQYFVKNAIPTESNFAELIDGMLSQRDDGIAKLPNDPLSIEAAGDTTSQKKAIQFYGSFSDANPTWVLSLNPRQEPANAATAKAGFSISDSAGNSRLFIERDTGKVGIGTVAPRARLDIPTGSAWVGRTLNISAASDGFNAGCLNIHNETNQKYWHITHRAGEDDKLIFWRKDATDKPFLAVLKLGMDGIVEAPGTVKANRFTSDNTLVLNDYTAPNPSSNVYLYSPLNDRDAWIYLDSDDKRSNWGIYHRQINTPVAGLPANSIAFVGGGASKLQAYVCLGDGSAFFAGNTSIVGKLTADGGVQANGKLLATGNAGVLDIEGTNHAYIQWYPMKAAAGRKGWIGYGNANITDMAIKNEAGELHLAGQGVRVYGDLEIEDSVGLGWARSTADFDAPLRSGFYQYDSPVGSPPVEGARWWHLISVRHSNRGNHNQLQIASRYIEDDRLFFRKISRDLTDSGRPAWNEIATVTNGILKIGDWTIESSGDNLFIKKGSSIVARFSTTWDRFLVYKNLNGVVPYFFFNEAGDFGRHDG